MGKAELERLAGDSWVIRGPSNVGVAETGDGEAVIVDAGNDADGGRRILRACEASGLRVTTIAITHSNADHTGGAAFIRSRTGCRVASPRAEAAIVETPLLEPALLWGGGPPAGLRGKFLMAEACPVDLALDPPCDLPGTGLRVLPLPGHFVAMAGFLSPDRVLYLGDALAGPEVLDKRPVFYLFDVGAALATLGTLPTIDADWFVPSHGAPTRDIAPLAELNRRRIEDIADFLLARVGAGAGGPGGATGVEDLVAALAERHGIALDLVQYALLSSTVRSYVSWLADRGELGLGFEGSRLALRRS